MGRKSLSSERLAMSMTKVRLVTSARGGGVTVQHLRRARVFADRIASRTISAIRRRRAVPC